MHWVAMLGMLAAQQEAEQLDLIDLLDDVDPVTRERIEEELERGGDLSELPILIEDVALAPGTRDGTISLFLLLSYERLPPERSATWFVVGLVVDLDEISIAPQAYGSPPDEQHRIDRCLAIARAPPGDRIARAERTARVRALECGGRP